MHWLITGQINRHLLHDGEERKVEVNALKVARDGGGAGPSHAC